ncbi:MAG: hypothetical protein IKD21_02840 [Clostridia bacterium]|nr:hypothetical protein [Clostridia bacterium]
MGFFKCYDKKIIEEFAIRTISKSFDSKFSLYDSPEDTNNFDFISPNKKEAIEITTVIPENEMQAYIYEKELYCGKNNLNPNKISNVKLREDGTLYSYNGGSMYEIGQKILEIIKKKHEIAIKRKENTCIDIVDLCICMVDGSLYDINSFEIQFSDLLEESIFRNIFFITPSSFIKYNKQCGFEEYDRKI